MKTKKWAIRSLLVLVVFLLSAALLISFLSWQNYQDKIYPNIKIGGVDLSGRTALEAQEILNKKTDDLLSQGLVFQYDGKKAAISTTISSFDSDLAYPALTFDVEGTVNQAILLGKKSYFNYLVFKLKPKNEKTIAPLYSLDEGRLKILLAEAFPELNIAPINSSFSISGETGELEAGPEKLGKGINYALAISETRAELDSLTSTPITIKTRSEYPEVTKSDLASLEKEARKIIEQDDLQLTYKDPKTNNATSTWKIKPEKLITWLGITKEKGNLKLSLNQEKISEYLLLNVSPDIDIEAARSRFEMKDGKVVSWQNGANGRELDLASSTVKIAAAFLAGQKEIELIVEEISAETTESQNNLEIKEIIGTGHSDFSGSPVNRRKNIAVGAAAVHGILLAPGEEFSLVKVLGDVSGASGYFQELVIKGNKTIKEYGGGLCQIGTTVFRAAIESGLPITARRNHSYRVAYYEPAGMDAAVYIPEPDVRFINDTASYILIQSRISGNDIYFDFWGTKDGREITISKPTIYNIVKPQPTKYVETTELEPGKEKCTESAHNGADAYFDYKVVYPENSTTTPVHERRFSSHYVPWQKVCLIGKSADTTSASSTTGISPETAPAGTAASSSPATSTNTN